LTFCESWNGLVGALDDKEGAAGTAQDNAKRLPLLAYQLARGVGRKRSEAVSKDGILPNKTWNGIFLLSGETAIESSHTRAGWERRLARIRVPSRAQGGVFDQLESGAGLIPAFQSLKDSVVQTISTNYGVAFPAFGEAVFKDWDHWASKAKHFYDEFQKRQVSGCDELLVNLCRIFAVAASGGMVAADLGLGPWKRDAARGACARLWQGVRTRLQNPDGAMKEIRKLQSWAATPTAFPMDKPGQAISPVDGKRVIGLAKLNRDYGKFIAVPTKIFESAFPNQTIREDMLSRLFASGIALPGFAPGKRVRQIQTGSRRDYYYCFNKRRLQVWRTD